MYRLIEEKLNQWRLETNRKPLIINGLRQVGKTWIMKDFANRYFEEVIYVNFDMETKYSEIFTNSKNPQYILEQLSILFRKHIDHHKTLIIFDEIQACNEALNALKYFNESEEDFYILCAGSYLGISLNQNESFPVGQVDLFDMHPMSLKEFMFAKQEEYLLEQLIKNREISGVLHNEMQILLHDYYISGGMPEVLKSWIKEKDISQVEYVQENILNAYYRDFAKYPPSSIVPKILAVWESIVPQLSKENKKFIYSHIKKGARAKEFEGCLEWLIAGRYLNKVPKVSCLKLPLNSYLQREHFKLYMPDIGLMRKKSEFPLELLNYGDSNSVEVKGVLAETYVLQELKHVFNSIYYWSDKNYEIDFVVQYRAKIWPIEVKYGQNVKSTSLKKILKDNPELVGIRYSGKNLSFDGKILNIPLYLVSETKRLIDLYIN